ncbi:MAG: helix-turn-helix domain-containing protein [Thermomicrobiales bacterium]
MPDKRAYIPKEVHVIGDVATLQVVADPLRLRLLEQLRREPQTVKQLAAALDVAQTKLYYHIKLLEERELIRVVESRVVQGIIEKQYGVTAYRLSVERTLLSPSAPAPDEGLEAFLSVVLDHTKSEIQRSVRAGLIDLSGQAPLDGSAILGRNWWRLTPEEAARMWKRIGEAMEEFIDLHPEGSDDPEVQFYEMLIGFYAVAPPEGGQGGSARDDPAPIKA